MGDHVVLLGRGAVVGAVEPEEILDSLSVFILRASAMTCRQVM
jgi:hypothetical protein